jgi:hypothetical protein
LALAPTRMTQFGTNYGLSSQLFPRPRHLEGFTATITARLCFRRCGDMDVMVAGNPCPDMLARGIGEMGAYCFRLGHQFFPCSLFSASSPLCWRHCWTCRSYIYSYKLFGGSRYKHHLSPLLMATGYLTATDNTLLPTRSQDDLSSSCLQLGPPWDPLVSSLVTLADVITILNSAALIRRPMVAQCGTAAVFFGTRDWIAQQATEKKRLILEGP